MPAMPPKRGSSPGPKAKAKPKAAKAKAAPAAKAAAAPVEDPKVAIQKEAEETFEKYKEAEPGEDGGEVIKLKGFVQLFRDTNIKKCQIWGEDPGPTVAKDQWKKTGGFSKKFLSRDEFIAWFPDFLQIVEDSMAEAEAAEAAKEAAKKEEAEQKASMYSGDGVWYIKLPQLLEAVDKAYEKGKTPLIIDNTEGFRTEVFFQYQSAQIIEGKKLIVEKAKGSSVEDLMAEVRDKFWAAHCFKYGSTVVFRLANSAPDFKNTFKSEVFPTLALLDANEVKKVLGHEQSDNFKGSPFFAMCANDDQRTEHTCMGVHDKFRVVAITQFQEADYQEFLDPMFPLDLMQPIKPSVD